MKRHASRLTVLIAMVAVSMACAATAAGARQAHDDPYFTNYWWKVTKVGHRYHTFGQWKACSVVTQGPGTLNCSRGFTVANTVTGQVGVTDGVISDSVGFSVTKSVTLTGGGGFNVPAGKSGTEYWRPEYNTRAVYQTEYEQTCPAHGSCFAVQTVKHGTAYASQVFAPEFRHSLGPVS